MSGMKPGKEDDEKERSKLGTEMSGWIGSGTRQANP